MKRTLTLRYPATCAECGAELAAGDRARYYGPYRVYGIGCHARTDPATRPRTSKVEQRAARKLHASQDAWDRTMHPERAAALDAADDAYINAERELDYIDAERDLTL